MTAPGATPDAAGPDAVEAALDLVDGWPVEHAAIAVVTPGGLLAGRGDLDRDYPIASVTKLLTATAVLLAVEEGALELDAPAGPPGATVRHLLAHAAGYGFDSAAPVLAAPGTRRIYSNRGYEELGAQLEAATGIDVASYLEEGVLAPLGMADSRLAGSPAYACVSTAADLARFAAELLRPTLLDPKTLAGMIEVQFPGLPGVLPGIGSYAPLDWGLGFERNFSRPGHWAGRRISAEAAGHFGAAGTFLWADPVAELACVCLTDREFGPWALDAWPEFCDRLLISHDRGAPFVTPTT